MNASIPRYVLYQKTVNQFFPTRIDDFPTVEDAQSKALELARIVMLEDVKQYRNSLTPIDEDGELRFTQSVTLLWLGSGDGVYLGSVSMSGTMTFMVSLSYAIRKE